MRDATNPSRRRAVCLALLALLLLAAAYSLTRLLRPADRLAEYKRTVGTEIPAAARRTAELALERITKQQWDALFAPMANRDSTVFGGRYVSGIFAGGDFAPAQLTGEAKRLEHSSIAHLMLKVHSIPRNRDYWMTLLVRDGKYFIGSISPAGENK